MIPTPEQVEQARAIINQVGVPTEKVVADVAQLISDADESKGKAERMVAVVNGCHDHNGGHRGENAEAFHHGIQTCINVLEAFQRNRCDDTQLAVLERIGRAAVKSKGEE